MASGSFGEHLRREREMRGVSLDEIAMATRIGTRFLEAMERDRWEQLPGGVFNRGFVRAVARFLGLDEENLVAEYALAVGDRAAAPVTNPATPIRTAQPFPVQKDTRRLSWVLAVIALAALVAGGWFGWHKHAAWSAVSHKAAPAPVQQPPPPSALEGAQPPAASNTADGNSVTTPRGINAAAGSLRSSPTPAPADPVTLELNLATGKDTEVRVVADGKSVLDGKMSAGQSERFQAQDKFEVWARDSSAVLLELNGQTVPPLGPPGSPGSVTLTRQDLRKPTGGNN